MRLNFLGLLVLVVIVGAAVGGAYGAGVVAGRASPTAPVQAQTVPAGAQAAGTTPAESSGGMVSQGGMAGRGLMGTIEKVEGDTLSLATPSGAVQVTLGQETSIQRNATASREELRPGVRLLVMGQQGSGGNLVASSIQILPAEEAAPGQQQRAKPQSTPASAP